MAEVGHGKQDKANMKIWGFFAVALLLANWLLPASADDLKPEQLYKRLLPSVMTLTVQKMDGTSATGTGFLAVKDGTAVTAWHVVQNAKSATAKFSDAEEFDVYGLVDKDEKQDVALVRVKEFGRPLLPLATLAPEVGAKAYTVGAPEGLEFSLSDGLISQIRDVAGVMQLQFTCPISPGNSGGPLINAEGQVVGVVAWRLKEGQNLNFAVPIAYVLTLDSNLMASSWDKANMAASADTSSDTALDTVMADGIKALADAATTIRFVDEEIVTKPGGYKARVPPCLYDVFNQTIASTIGVSSTHSADPVREAARVALEKRLSAALESLTLESQEVDAAKEQHNWGGKAGQLFAQSLVPYQEFTDEYPETVKKLASAACQAALLATGPFGNFAVGKEQDFRLRAYSWVHSPLTLAVVPRDGLAFSLGLRTGDTLVFSGGHAPVSLCSLKADLLANTGGRLRIVVQRDGKRKEWVINIPHDLQQRSICIGNR